MTWTGSKAIFCVKMNVSCLSYLHYSFCCNVNEHFVCLNKTEMCFMTAEQINFLFTRGPGSEDELSSLWMQQLFEQQHFNTHYCVKHQDSAKIAGTYDTVLDYLSNKYATWFSWSEWDQMAAGKVKHLICFNGLYVSSSSDRTWLSVPMSVGAYWSLMLTNFCSMGSSRSRAGLISFSGSFVSTVVLAMAIYFPCAATLWAKEIIQT